MKFLKLKMNYRWCVLSTSMFDQFFEPLEGLFIRIRKNDNYAPKIRLLFPKSKKVSSFLEKSNISQLPSVEIQYIHEDEFQYFIAGVDKSISLFSEMKSNFEIGTNTRFSM